MNAPELRDLVSSRLRRLLSRARLRAAVHGVVAWLGTGGAVLLLAALTLGWTTPAPWVRWGLSAGSLAVAVGAALVCIWRPLRRLRRPHELAHRLESGGDFANALAAAEEAVRLPDRWRDDDPARAELVRRLLARAASHLERLDLARVVPLPRAGTALALAAGVIVMAAVVWQGDPEAWNGGWRQWSRPWHGGGPDPRVGLYLVPGADHVIAGQDAVLAAMDFGGGTGDALCEVRAGSGLWRPLPAVGSLPLVDASGAPYVRWQTVLTQVQEEVDYRFRRGERVTESRRLEVWQPPLLGDLRATVKPPAYTRLPLSELPRVPGFFEVPEGSRVELAGRASEALAGARLIGASAETLALEVRGRDLAGTLTVTKPLRFHVALRDRRGLTNRDRTEVEVAVLADQVPLAALSRPDDDGQLPLTAPLPLLAAAGDDYGLSGVDLLLRRDGAPDWERLALWPGGGDEVRALTTALGPLRMRVQTQPAPDAQEIRRFVTLDVAELALVPGDVVEVGLEARDNREPGPPGVGRSPVLRLTVPSNLDLLAEKAQDESSRRAELADARRRSAALGQDLERLRRELMKNPQPDWDKQQEVQAALERHREMQAELSELAKAMQKDLETLASNQLTSPELLAKMDQIAELLRDAASPQLQQLLDELREAAAQLSPPQVAQAVQEVAQNQQELLRRLDTAMAMLKDLAREQELEGMTSLLAQMMRKQQELAEQSRAQAPAPDSQDLARREEALAQEMDALKEQLEKALSELQEQQKNGDESPTSQQMREALEQALKQMEQDQTSKDMQQAGKEMQEGQPSQAAQQMQQSLAEMAGLYSVLLRTQSAMQMAMQQSQAASLRGLASDLLSLSDRQEQIHLDLPAEIQDLRTEPLARRQHQVVQSTIRVRDELAKVAAASPREILRLLNKIDDLLAVQGQAVDDLEAGNGGPARGSTRESLAQMNRIVIGLLTQAQMMSNSGGGGSCNNPMPQLGQQLQEMTREQAELNGLADQLRRQQGLSEQLRAQMQRLQQGQQGLSGRARDLAEQEKRLEPPDSGRILGDMGELAREMEKVADDLSGGLVTDDILRRQERILSRLLDAHNASRERDFTRRRESRTSDQLYAEQEGRERDALLDRGSAARRFQPVELAPPAYRELVRRYFQDIQELQQRGRGPGDGGQP